MASLAAAGSRSGGRPFDQPIEWSSTSAIAVFVNGAPRNLLSSPLGGSHVRDKIEELQRNQAEARISGGEERIAAKHAKGQLTARERLDYLLDAGSFVEVGMFSKHHAHYFGMPDKHYWGDGVVTGYGRINSRLVYVYAQDFTVLGGSLGEMMAHKIAQLQDQALQNGVPIIGLNDSGGARIQEGVEGLAGYGEIFYRNVTASGVVPQITAIMGPCAGGAVYSPALTDFILMTRGTGHMFVTGPAVIKSVTNEDVTLEDLGGARVHSEISGVAHLVADSEEETLDQIKALLSYIPSNNVDDPPRIPPQDDPYRADDSLATILPDSPNKPYDVKGVIERVVDNGEFLEIHEHWAKNIVIGFARLDGYPVGIIANQPAVLAGVLDIHASQKAARFIRFLDAFHFPIISFIDVPGFLPGTEQEHGGIIRHGAKLLYAYCEATVPKLAVILRKAYGGAYLVMSSKHIRSDVNLAWPSAEIAVMGPEGAVNIIFRKELKEAEDTEARRAELVEDYRTRFANPYIAAERGFLDDIIEPAETRPRIIEHLWTLLQKREDRPPKKHGNLPI